MSGVLLAASLAIATALLAAAARVPLAFEDGYQHWLIAAGFAQTGRLRDPLFGMEDTWLPGYHVVAGAVLKVAGLGQIDALRALSVVCALATLALLFRIAGGGRRGVISVLLLALNPIFLLTATSVVAEPLLTLCLVGATGALLERRIRIAAVLVAAACLVGTKAWLWLAIVLAVNMAVHLAAGRVKGAPALRRAVLWVVPSLAVVVVLQVLLGPVGHSLGRAAQEVASAAGRGSVSTGPLTRGGDFLGYFWLASLPIALLAPLGFLNELSDRAGRLRLRTLHVPAVIYLAFIAVLVFAGIYMGSHRYLYPALPALALLAAAALDRAPAPSLGIAGLGAGLVAIAFVPVLQSFGALDDGLARAGRATSAVPGGLLTDSPAAAYWSGKPPSLITGSRDLPADPDQAVARLRGAGVTSLVLEDISYYRVNTIFPGLAKGHALAPFEAVGAPSDYSAPGGKAIAVYRLGGGMRFLRTAPGSGKTAALTHGAGLEVQGKPVNGEGVGFAVPLLRYSDGDWFAGSSETVDLGSPGVVAWKTVFTMDRRGVDDDRSFQAAPSRGQFEVTYRVNGGSLAVTIKAIGVQAGYSRLVVLNELSAAFDDFADPTQTRIGDSVGSWTPVLGSWARFRSSALGLEWSLPALPGAVEFHAARELRAPDINFSGLEYTFGPGFTGANYTVTVGGAR